MESALRAKDAGATVYVASVAKNMIGMERAHRHYATVARELGMNVLVCNGVGHADGFEMTGGSAAWDNRGRRSAAPELETRHWWCMTSQIRAVVP